MSDALAFFRQFREQFHTTGAVAPSSRFLAAAITRAMRAREKPSRILEVGPGTGACTSRIVRELRDDDHFDLVEINPAFVEILNRNFATKPDYQRVADQATIHSCPIQEFQTDAPYDFVISGLPLNNFSPEMVTEILAAMMKLLAPDGRLSYFEYMYVRTFRRFTSGKAERARLAAIEKVLAGHIEKSRYRRDWVFVNFPPAWVQHLTKTPES